MCNCIREGKKNNCIICNTVSMCIGCNVCVNKKHDINKTKLSVKTVKVDVDMHNLQFCNVCNTKTYDSSKRWCINKDHLYKLNSKKHPVCKVCLTKYFKCQVCDNVASCAKCGKCYSFDHPLIIPTNTTLSTLGVTQKTFATGKYKQDSYVFKQDDFPML